MSRTRIEPPPDPPAHPPDPRWNAAPAPPEPEPSENPEFRRRRQPVRVRRSTLADAVARLRSAWKPILAAALLAVVAGALYHLLFQTPWFVLAGSDQIQVVGALHTPPDRVAAVFASDLGRNVFFIPLPARRQALEAIPWIRTAQVLRLWPARLQVRIAERTPIAFARADDALKLLDAQGVLLDRPASGNFDFPVLAGLAGADAPDPNLPALVQSRRTQLQLYLALRSALDPSAFQSLSEITVADPANIEAQVALPGDGDNPAGTVLVKFGNHDFAARYNLFVTHIRQWQADHPLQAVDLSTDGEVRIQPVPQPKPATPTKKDIKTRHPN